MADLANGLRFVRLVEEFKSTVDEKSINAETVFPTFEYAPKFADFV